MVFHLPKSIGSSALMPFLSALGRCEDPNIAVDFSALSRITPTGLASLAASVHRWRKNGQEVEFIGLEQCPITAYLQRMNLLQICGVELPETFARHNPKSRFVPLQAIDHRVDEMGKEMAGCLAPGGEEYENPLSDLYELAWYVLTETANNARQHGQGFGCVTAQVRPGEGLIRVAIADNGKGILRSFQDAGLAWSQDMTSAQAIRKALEPKVSCKGEPTNQGVGLTLVSGLARLTKAWLMIVSGTGVVVSTPEPLLSAGELPNGGHYQGTLVALAFRQDRIRHFVDILEEAKTEAGLLRPRRVSTIFKE